MCIAARKRIRFPITIVSETWTEIAEKYIIVYLDGRVGYTAAFPCHTNPKIYVGTTSIVPNSFTAMIVIDNMPLQ